MIFCDRIIERYSLPKGRCCVACHDESDNAIHLVKIELRGLNAAVCCSLLDTLKDRKLIKEGIHG